ncbi:hypothetical protein AB0L10_31170 [Streptomyces flaveolus]
MADAGPPRPLRRTTNSRAGSRTQPDDERLDDRQPDDQQPDH